MTARTDKGYKGMGMEGPIARWYATSTGKNPRLDEQIRQVTPHAPPGSAILEVAPGPGFLAIALAKTGHYTVTGLDISETFVEIARANAAKAGVEVDFRHGNAADMPFPAGSFDFIVCCAAFKNFSQPVEALREMCRVLRPGGTALVLDLRHDVSKEAVEGDVAGMRLGPVSRRFTTFVLQRWLPRRAYTVEQFDAFIAQTAFRSPDIRQTAMSLEIELHK